jgi:phosphatidylserine decarboxylase
MSGEDARSASLLDHLRSWALYPLPHHLLSRLMLALTRVRCPRLVPAAIRLFSRHFQVNLDEALESDPAAYDSFNAFFTRALRAGARPLDSAADSIVSPADGTVSQCGIIRDGALFQAKGRDYSLLELLGGDAARAAAFEGGSFSTIYLSPRDYHRVHMPLDGTLRETIYVPGRLFSVAPHTVRTVPRLFARNERLIALFDTDHGPMAVILVGAIFVACIETIWTGVATPPHTGRIRAETPHDHLHLAKGAELGRFNMGSTVILLFGKDRARWESACNAGTSVRVGQRIGSVP